MLKVAIVTRQRTCVRRANVGPGVVRHKRLSNRYNACPDTSSSGALFAGLKVDGHSAGERRTFSEHRRRIPSSSLPRPVILPCAAFVIADRVCLVLC